MGNCRKYGLLLWKNWKIAAAHPCRTFLEIFIPIILFSMIVLVRKYTNSPSIESTFEAPKCREPKYSMELPKILHYYPPSQLIKNLLQEYSRIKERSIRPSADINPDINDTKQEALVIFNNVKAEDKTFPKHLNITIRTQPDQSNELIKPLYPNYDQHWSVARESGKPNFYRENGLTYLQRWIFNQLLNASGVKETTVPGVCLERFPFQAIDELFLRHSSIIISMMMMFSLLLPFVNSARILTIEKQNQLKESMKIMGMPIWIHWLSWFTRAFIIIVLNISLIMIVLKVNYSKFPISLANPFLLFLFLLFYGIASITLSFLLSSFFTSPNKATFFATALWILSYFPFFAIFFSYDDVPLVGKIFICLLPNAALASGFLLMSGKEIYNERLTFSTFFEGLLYEDKFSVGLIVFLLLIEAVLFQLVTLYIDNVFPGSIGVAKPWYFLCYNNFCCKKKELAEVEDITARERRISIEEFNEKTPVAVQIKNLSKSFGKNEAVKNLSLDIYEKQITVMLGHNGAGKTTTMSMLTGMYGPDKGTAIINGRDIKSEMDSIRSKMGLCLQHNVLFDDLTVRDHIYFFSSLRGMTGKEANEEAERIISVLEFKEAAATKAVNLSGGMKRKLAVANALCGNPNMIILDEPSSGLDPSARRLLWDVLIKEKKETTIILTTHDMEEADVLADKIAIMSNGELRCYGTSFYLKKKYGIGYYLIFDALPSSNPMKVLDFVRRYVPEAKFKSRIQSEIILILPDTALERFETMLNALEGSLSSLEVRSFGLSVTSLDDVFLRIWEQTEKEKTTESADFVTLFKTKQLRPVSRFCNQFLAMFLKHGLVAIRSWLTSGLLIIIPLLILFPLLHSVTNYSTSDDDSKNLTFTPVVLNLNKYDKAIIPVASNVKIYKNLSVKRGHEVKTVRNLEDYIQSELENNSSSLRLNHIIGSSSLKYRNENVYIAWSNIYHQHSDAISYSMALNGLYKQFRGKEHNIEFISHPLSKEKPNVHSYFRFGGEELVFLIISVTMIFVMPIFVPFVIREKTCSAKQMQITAGVSMFAFWSVKLLFDLIMYHVTVIVIIIGLAAFKTGGFSTPTELAVLYQVLLLFGLAELPLIYILSLKFNSPAAGIISIILIALVTGIVFPMILVVGHFSGKMLDPFHYISLIFPNYFLTISLLDFSLFYEFRSRIKVCSLVEDMLGELSKDVDVICMAYTNNQLSEILLQFEREMQVFKRFFIVCCKDFHYYALTRPGIGANLIAMATLAFILMLLLIGYEYTSLQFFTLSHIPTESAIEDNDVLEEINLIKTTPIKALKDKYAIIAKNLTKHYDTCVVNGIYFTVSPNECFGLLGVNGAGKTTTFKMLIGEVGISYGNAWVEKFNVKHEIGKIYKCIGYCPQFDAFLDELTGKENLLIFGLIRGLSWKHSIEIAVALSKSFGFFDKLKHQARTYSGGTKRKLSTSMALVGNPEVVFLDECTTGVDPASKRHIWDTIHQFRSTGKSIILTSHSMQECEALCTRLTIMVDGKFYCIGSLQHIKSKYGRGFTLNINVKSKDTDVVEQFIGVNFHGATLKEKHGRVMSYHLPDTKMPYSKMFGIMERNKRALRIDSYTLSQCNLEEIFLKVSEKQE